MSEELTCFIPLAHKSKEPVYQNWPDRGQTLCEAMGESQNIGLILGEKSGMLDVDLDCREAKYLAEIILPLPWATFDRGTPDSGHYLYQAKTTGPRKSLTSSDKSTLLELRGDRSQTMVPPSIHPNGVKLSFTAFNEDAAPVHYNDLLRSVYLLAACSEIMQNWQKGIRHKLALSFSGLARKLGLEFNFVMQIVQKICKIKDDLELDDRVNTVRTTFDRRIDSIIGLSGLIECLG